MEYAPGEAVGQGSIGNTELFQRKAQIKRLSWIGEGEEVQDIPTLESLRID